MKDVLELEIQYRCKNDHKLWCKPIVPHAGEVGLWTKLYAQITLNFELFDTKNGVLQTICDNFHVILEVVSDIVKTIYIDKSLIQRLPSFSVPKITVVRQVKKLHQTW